MYDVRPVAPLETMAQALQLSKFGDLSSLAVTDVAIPEPGVGQVIVEMNAASLPEMFKKYRSELAAQLTDRFSFAAPSHMLHTKASVECV